MTPEDYAFTFQGETLVARPSGALWYPAERTLIVADLHLGRPARFARRGGALLPPYADADTLARLRTETEALNPARVISLGDGFDDDEAARTVSPEVVQNLQDMAQRRDWIWISGNHDPQPLADHLPGRSLALWQGGLTLRHEAGNTPDISGHYHPVVRLAGRRWRCFLRGDQHLILPAFGSYTGGLDITAPVLRALGGTGYAIFCGDRARPVAILPAS